MRFGRGIVIVLSGVDGAGKSTQVEALSGALAATNEVRWFRPGYSSRLEFIRKLLRRAGVLRVEPGSGPQRDAALARRGVGTVWLAAAIFDACIEFAIVARSVRPNQVVIYDRWVVDALIDLDISFEDHTMLRRLARRLLPFVARQPDHAFLLLVDADEAATRRSQKDDPYVEAERVAASRHLLYTLHAAEPSCEYTIVDGTGPTTVVHRKILTLVGGQ